MNLPATATEFLHVFRGAFRRSSHPLPLVHCYTFMRGTEEEAVRGVRAEVEEKLGGQIPENDPSWQVHVVRDVAPNKVMLCVTFRVPESIAYGPTEARKRKAEGEAGDATA